MTVMADRIYATYTPTTAPGTFHTAIHFERTDPTGKVQHYVIEAQPENLDEMDASDKGSGVIEEALRNSNSPSRFGRIVASVDRWDPRKHDPGAPYEPIDEGEDLSEPYARMHLFAKGLNDAGFAYRGDHQNSNTFASAALKAAGLPPATGVAYDPTGPRGELLEYFAPGLNEPLRRPIGLSGGVGLPRPSDGQTAAPAPTDRPELRIPPPIFFPSY